MKRKDFYTEIGINYRYFLDWRHKLLAGYLVTISGLSVGFSWAWTNSELKKISWIFLIIGIVVSLVFWALDYRNRDLYHLCQEAGAKIESQEADIKYYGQYSAMIKSNSNLSHSKVLNALFFTASIVFFVGAVVILCKF